MKLSLKSLIKLLLINDIKYVIERCKEEEFKDRMVLQFVVSHGYPYDSHVHIGKTVDEVNGTMEGKRHKRDGFVLLHFDAGEDRLLSATTSIHSMIRGAKTQTVNKQIRNSVEKLQCSTT